MNISNEKRELLETIDNRRGKMVGNLIKHDNLFKTVPEGFPSTTVIYYILLLYII